MKLALVSPYDFAYPGGVTEHVAGVVGQLDDTHLPTMAGKARLVRDREEAEPGPHMLTAGTG